MSKSISIRGVTYDKLRARCQELALPMSTVVDNLMIDYLDNIGKPSKRQPIPVIKPDTSRQAIRVIKSEGLLPIPRYSCILPNRGPR